MVVPVSRSSLWAAAASRIARFRYPSRSLSQEKSSRTRTRPERSRASRKIDNASFTYLSAAGYSPERMVRIPKVCSVQARLNGSLNSRKAGSAWSRYDRTASSSPLVNAVHPSDHRHLASPERSLASRKMARASSVSSRARSMSVPGTEYVNEML